MTQVSRGTLMGSYIREFWLPVVPSVDVIAGNAPRRVQLLGESLVVFRTPSGSIGVIEEHCPHRRASLALGWNEEAGLRCLYHGWQVDCDGRTIDTPTEPDTSFLKTRIPKIGYRVCEAGGFIWAYMGGRQNDPPGLPAFEWLSLPDAARFAVLMREECNWAQCVEGVIDSAHSNYLHRGGIRPDQSVARVNGASVYKASGDIGRPSADGRPNIEIDDTPFGFRYGAIRHPLGDGIYVRTTHFVAPTFSFFPAPPGWGNMQMFVPMNNEHTMFFYIRYRTDGGVIDEEMREQFVRRSGLRPEIDLDSEYRKLRNAENGWLQDRQLMSESLHSGLFGVQTEDAAVQESMGAVVDRSREHLGRTDRAVMHMRRLMLEAAQAFEQGQGVRFQPEDVSTYRTIRGGERILEPTADWRVVGAINA